MYSTYALFAMTEAQVSGDMNAIMTYMHELYFESAAMILTLITVGKMLEARSKGKTTDALKGLDEAGSKNRCCFKGRNSDRGSCGAGEKGRYFCCAARREHSRLTGLLLRATGAVDESALTGESIPVDKAEGDPVSAGTINQSGFI